MHASTAVLPQSWSSEVMLFSAKHSPQHAMVGCDGGADAELETGENGIEEEDEP